MGLFELKAREIFRHICPFRERGIVNPSTGAPDPQSGVRMRYAGFAEAQRLIIEELKAITATKRNLGAQAKAARGNRSKLQPIRLRRSIEREEYKEAVIRRLADSIAWQLIDGRSDVVHWLHSYEKPPSIDESNFESVLEEVNESNESDPLSFALISDLTSFIRVGDILRRDTSNVREIIEVKAGEENIKAIWIVENELTRDLDGPSLARLKDVYGPHLVDQARRIQRQVKRGNKVREIINTGAGEDPNTGTSVMVREPQQPPANYTRDLAEQLRRLDKRPWAYTVIEGCLMVGCYRGLMKKAGSTLLNSLARNLFEENNMTVSLSGGLKIPLCEPIFLKPLREDDIFDIVFDRKRVFMVLSVDRLLQSFRERGAEVKWLSKKETDRLMQRDKYERPLVFNGKAVSINNNEWSMLLTGGGLRRIFFDNLLPSSLVSMFLDSLANQP